MKKGLSLLLILICLFSFGCSKGSSSEGNVSSPVDVSNELYNEFGRKIYYTVTYSLDISDVSNGITKITNQVSSLGGYVESSSESMNDDDYSYARYVYRVPTDKLEEFLAYVDGNSAVTNKSIQSTDITSQYASTDARLETLEASKVAYVKLLEKDNLSISDIITINNKIEDIDTEISELTKLKNSYDSLLDYSIVTINFTGNNDTFFTNYGNYLINVVKVVFSIIMYTLPFGLVAGIILLIIYISQKKKQNKNKQV